LNSEHITDESVQARIQLMKNPLLIIVNTRKKRLVAGAKSVCSQISVVSHTFNYHTQILAAATNLFLA